MPAFQRWDIDEEEENKLQIKCHSYRVSEEKDHLLNDLMTKVIVEQPGYTRSVKNVRALWKEGRTKSLGLTGAKLCKKCPKLKIELFNQKTFTAMFGGDGWVLELCPFT